MKSLVVSILVLAACGGGSGDDSGDDGSGSDDEYVDIGTWNLRMFQDASLAPRIASLITSAHLDVVTFEEIESDAAFTAVVAALPGWDGMLTAPVGSATGGLAVAWNPGAITLANHETAVAATAANPRPSLRLSFTVNGTPFDLYSVHFKAGTQVADEQARIDGNVALEPIVRSHHDAVPHALVIGDFNEDLHDARSNEVFAPWDPSRYTLIDTALATNGGVTFLPADIMLDHMVATKDLPPLSPEIPTWAAEMADYESAVSDHLPLIVRIQRSLLE